MLQVKIAQQWLLKILLRTLEIAAYFSAQSLLVVLCTYPVLSKSSTCTWGNSSKSDLNATSLILWNIAKHSWLHRDFSVSL